jgi:hypothetical protein
MAPGAIDSSDYQGGVSGERNSTADGYNRLPEFDHSDHADLHNTRISSYSLTFVYTRQLDGMKRVGGFQCIR